jgi:hypothetical protein
MKKNIFCFLFLSAAGGLNLLLNLSCNTTEPNNNDKDTTSHNFTFQTWSFGIHSSSILYDVAIIDENNIWAVGEIYLNDSTGQPDPHSYNGAHWNGIEWELLKIPTLAWNSNNIFWSDPLKALWVFDHNNIWVTTGSQVINFNGNHWLQHHFLFTDIYDTTFGGINRFWAKTSNILYGVGDKENIWLFNNQDWNRINIGELKFYDIKGSSLNENEIYAFAANQSVNSNKKIYRIENKALTELNVNGIPSSIRGIWFKPGEKYYVVGSGMFYKNNINSNESWISFGGTV